MLSRILKFLFITAAMLLLLAITLVWRIDRTPLQEQEYYHAMHAKLDTLQPEFKTDKAPLQVGWKRVNITPAHPMPMAGYRPRESFDTVHDSLYANILLLGNGDVTIAFVNVDLLLFPPSVRDAVTAKLADKSYFLYPAATHTHNGVGGWDDSTLGELVVGDYHPSWVEETSTAIANAIRSVQLLPAKLNYRESDASQWIENRINVVNGHKDGVIRVIEFKRADSARAMLYTFGAHATSILKESRMLSADYPGELSHMLRDKTDFAMYMSGMVGSHRFIWFAEDGDDLLRKEATLLYDSMPGRVLFTADSVAMRGAHVPIEFGSAQVRIHKDWKVRDWVFRLLNRPLRGDLTWVEIGDLVFIGTPCDFSGELFVNYRLDELAASHGKHLVITSFNGDYVGYITDDRNYDVSKNEEVMGLNWVGPYYGEYFVSMIGRLLEK